MGKYPKDRRGTAQDGHSVSIFALPPVPHYGGYPLGQAEHFRRAKSEWQSKFPPAHWGLTLWKISSGAVPQPRLALPNQRSRCVSWREAQGLPYANPEGLLILCRGGRLPLSRGDVERSETEGIGICPSRRILEIFRHRWAGQCPAPTKKERLPGTP